MLRCRLYPNKVGEVPIHKTSDGKLNAAHACCTAESINILLVESFIILNNWVKGILLSTLSTLAKL